MIIQYRDDQDSKERSELIEKIFPEKTLIESKLEPMIESRLFDILNECLRAELEIYRAYPKKKSEEKIEDQVKTFDPRNNGTCFQGKAFKSNGHITDSELVNYRKRIGTIHHCVWGNCTLLEIWGGDHFEDHNEMVVDAFKYGMGLIDKMPNVVFHINPLFKNKKSKDFKLSPAQEEYEAQMEMLLAKAMVFGINEPKKRKKK